MTERPIHDWMLPRLELLLQEAKAAGFARAPCVAVIADIMMGPEFNDAPPPPPPELSGPPVPVPPATDEYDAPSLGPTEWINPTVQI